MAQVLKEDDLARLKEGLRSAEEAIRQAEMAIQAGLPAQDKLGQAQKTRDQLLRFKQTYFPGL